MEPYPYLRITLTRLLVGVKPLQSFSTERWAIAAKVKKTASGRDCFWARRFWARLMYVTHKALRLRCHDGVMIWKLLLFI